MHEEKLDIQVLRKLDVTVKRDIDLSQWESFLYKLKNPINEITIGLVGKYVELQDALTNYNNSQLNFVEAVFNYNVARETLLKSMGVR